MSRPVCPKRVARNRRIVRAYIEGESRFELSRRYGITPRMVSRIVSAARPAMRAEDRLRICADRAGSSSAGRPREIFLPPDQMAHYVKLRRYLGAAAARRELGLLQRG